MLLILKYFYDILLKDIKLVFNKDKWFFNIIDKAFSDKFKLKSSLLTILSFSLIFLLLTFYLFHFTFYLSNINGETISDIHYKITLNSIFLFSIKMASIYNNIFNYIFTKIVYMNAKQFLYVFILYISTILNSYFFINSMYKNEVIIKKNNILNDYKHYLISISIIILSVYLLIGVFKTKYINNDIYNSILISLVFNIIVYMFFIVFFILSTNVKIFFIFLLGFFIISYFNNILPSFFTEIREESYDCLNKLLFIFIISTIFGLIFRFFFNSIISIWSFLISIIIYYLFTLKFYLVFFNSMFFSLLLINVLFFKILNLSESELLCIKKYINKIKSNKIETIYYIFISLFLLYIYKHLVDQQGINIFFNGFILLTIYFSVFSYSIKLLYIAIKQLYLNVSKILKKRYTEYKIYLSTKNSELKSIKILIIFIIYNAIKLIFTNVIYLYTTLIIIATVYSGIEKVFLPELNNLSSYLYIS